MIRGQFFLVLSTYASEKIQVVLIAKLMGENNLFTAIRPMPLECQQFYHMLKTDIIVLYTIDRRPD